MSATLAVQEVGKLPLMAVEGGAFSGRDDEKMAAPLAAHTGKTPPTAVGAEVPPVQVCLKLVAFWPPRRQARCPRW
jgi:hypothetical protein